MLSLNGYNYPHLHRRVLKHRELKYYGEVHRKKLPKVISIFYLNNFDEFYKLLIRPEMHYYDAIFRYIGNKHFGIIYVKTRHHLVVQKALSCYSTLGSNFNF